MTKTGTAARTSLSACGELRREVESVCSSVAALRDGARGAAEALTRARVALREAEARLSEAQHAADPRVVADAKAQARRVYRRDYGSAANDGDRQRAATTWLREVDRVNREARSAMQSLEHTRREVARSDLAVQGALATADAERIRAETAADACRTARERLAACEEREGRTSGSVESVANGSGRDGSPDAGAGVAAAWVTSPEGASVDRGAGAASDGGDPDPDEAPERPTIVIERLVQGDRRALRSVSTELAEATGLETTRYVLLLQELMDAIATSASREGYLDFGEGHPFWGQFSPEETRAIVRALAGMGCRYESREGWAKGHEPGLNEFSLAMAHAGYDLRGVRGLPSANAYGDLFRGARVAVDDLLARRAPQLALDDVMELCGPEADGLGELWDNWGRLRPLLLAVTV